MAWDQWIRRGVATAMLLPVVVATAHSQSAASGIIGTVRDSVGHPIDAVVVEARDGTTGYVQRAATNSTGRYILLGLPLGGPYVVSARRVGYIRSDRPGITLTIGAREIVDLVLRVVPVRLTELNVRADAEAGRESRIGGSTRIAREQIDALPIPDRNFSGLASLSPLAGNQLSLGGQRWTSTDLRIDGAQSRNLLRAGEANGGPAAISLEAVREFEVNTAVFDVGQGRQGGGQIAAVTRAGANSPEARLYTGFRNEHLAASTDFQGRSRAARTAQTLQTALSLGGPLVRDRAHYFLAYERQDASEPLTTGDVSTAEAQVASGIARDSLVRLLDVLTRQYGTDPAVSQTGQLGRRSVSQTLFARVDWQLAAAHRATVRLTASDWVSPLSGGVDQAIALREARSGFSSREAQLLSTLTSHLGERTLNEVQIAFGTSRRALIPESPGVPRGFVQVRSLLPNGTTGNSTIQFGGNRLAPDESREWQLQLMNRLTSQRGSVLWTLGTDNSLVATRTLIAEAQGGLFVFPSLAALEARQPNRFTRTVPLSGASPVTRQRVLELGAYGQVEWQVTDRITWTNGMRWDATAFLDAPAANAAIDSVFQVRTARAPRDLAQLQPRTQLVWRLQHDARDIIRVGAGAFTAQLPYYAGHNQLLYTGSTLADIDLRGTAVPTPDFARYRAAPLAVPGLPAGAVLSPAYVNVAGAVRAPRTWKGSATWWHRIGDGTTVTLGVQASRMRDGYAYVDRNLRNVPAFVLTAEGNRAVWVPANTIPAATGVTDVRNASQHPAYARVLALESGARAEQVAVTGEVAFRLGDRAQGTMGYAWSRARDNSSYGCCLARTTTTFTPVVDDPRALGQAWGVSDFDARHRLTGALSVRAPFKLAITARYVGTTGRPFSLVVDGDINGDEANGNDRAFLFDPGNPTTPADVAASMRRVLANPNNLARRYIASHLGQVSGRNTITTPFTNRVDARIARQFRARGSGALRSAELIIDVYNVGNLLNRRWGAQYLLPVGISSQNPVVNRVPLLRVVGFDPATQRYRYSVNESAGVLPKGGDPYQVQIGVRIAR
ncbi:carboxypeptidase-like regulatory domain-containing protein [Gemmatimonas groenlandica]|uniref:Carboxypeptidase regulatory-like domain-containing protein n=1 Tax=Gemmatimonas groenlandica TaxID=2732249 RepID=A0A6M4II37_9BACT|nr:carboxypeptidase-like regulatory domain-containing protein [Gemmatimonas groenlandica]QJR34280.1 carboxypeptidase regulatory-like domain-containing protein [Gemmatimonas groenlandica]